MSVKNGRISTKQLRQVDGWAWLSPGAAAAWLLFAFAAQMRWGIRPTITSPDGAYRSYVRQVWWWVRRYVFGIVVAPPGTSNHGLGMAIDVSNWARFPRAAFVALAAQYGFIFDTRSENWHIRYTGSPDYYPLTTASLPGLVIIEEDDMALARMIQNSATKEFAIVGGSPGTKANAYRCFSASEASQLRKDFGLPKPLGYNDVAYEKIIADHLTPVG